MKVEMNFQEILHEALSLVKDVPVYFGAAHLAQCDKVHRTASLFEQLGDAGRENARYACTLIAGVGQSPRVRALCGYDDDAYSFTDIGEISANFIRKLCNGEVMEGEYPTLVEAIKPYLDQCLEGLRDWSKEHPVTSLGRWIASVRQVFSAEEMWAIAIYANKGDPVNIVNERFVLPVKEKQLPCKWASDMCTEEIGRLEKTQNSTAVKRLVQTYHVLDPNCQNVGGTFNGTVSKYTAALILRDYEYLVNVFGDFDIEEVEGSDGGYYYLCCPNKILELYR